MACAVNCLARAVVARRNAGDDADDAATRCGRRIVVGSVGALIFSCVFFWPLFRGVPFFLFLSFGASPFSPFVPLPLSLSVSLPRHTHKVTQRKLCEEPSRTVGTRTIYLTVCTFTHTRARTQHNVRRDSPFVFWGWRGHRFLFFVFFGRSHFFGFFFLSSASSRHTRGCEVPKNPMVLIGCRGHRYLFRFFFAPTLATASLLPLPLLQSSSGKWKK